MINNTVLFICAANVGRSQVAEGIFNHLHGKGSSLSCAGSEAKKGKYNQMPAEAIVSLMRDYGGIDISSQRIKYLSDIGENTLARVRKVIFLFDPNEELICEEACTLNGFTPYVFLQRRSFPIETHKIPDPYHETQDRWTYIYDRIFDLVSQLK